MIGRVDAVLGALGSRAETLGISEIARRTGIPKASTSRIVAELVEHGYLERTDAGVGLGLRLFELGGRAARPLDLRRLALVHMADLRGATGQTVHLAVLEGTEVVYIEILRSRSTPPLPSRVGGRVPAYATGVGKALLADLPPERLEAHLPERLVPVGPRTVTDRELLVRELAGIRERRISYEREESAPDVGCAAVAIRGEDGEPIAAISVSVHLGSADLAALGIAVATAANAIAREAAKARYRGAGGSARRRRQAR